MGQATNDQQWKVCDELLCPWLYSSFQGQHLQKSQRKVRCLRLGRNYLKKIIGYLNSVEAEKEDCCTSGEPTDCSDHGDSSWSLEKSPSSAFDFRMSLGKVKSRHLSWWLMSCSVPGTLSVSVGALCCGVLGWAQSSCSGKCVWKQKLVQTPWVRRYKCTENSSAL